MAVVLGSSDSGIKNALWTDSRYYIQAQNQLDPDHWILMKTGLKILSRNEMMLILKMKSF